MSFHRRYALKGFFGGPADPEEVLQIVDETNGERAGSSLMGKLEHLKETKEQFTAVLHEWNSNITEETPFRDMATEVERKRKLYTDFFNCAQGKSNNSFTPDSDGIYTVTTRGITYRFYYRGYPGILIAPESVKDDFPINRLSHIALNAVGLWQGLRTDEPVEGYDILDLSRIDMTGDASRLETTFSNTFAPSFLAFPSEISSQGNFAGFPVCSRSDRKTAFPHLFAQGISFGKSIGWSSVNSFFTADISDLGDRVVTVEPDFVGSLYLSRISMSAETMVNIFNNLKDMSGTTTVYTLDVGPNNLAKLTEEQLNIAYAKGWNIT